MSPSLNSRPLRLALFLLACGVLCFGQSAAQLEGRDVKRVASRLACQCGSCKSTVACEMPGGCGYCKRLKTQIAKEQDAGKSDKAIIDQMVKENGPEIYLSEPGTWGWLAPYLAAVLGLLVIFWFVRKNLKPAPVAAGGPSLDDSALNRYQERIDRDLEKLE